MSDFCIVCVTRNGSYWIMEYMCKTFGLVEGNEWFGRNKEVDLKNPFELKQKRLDIDFNVNEDLLHDKDIKDRLKHLENFPAPFCIKAMPPQFTNTVESVNLPIEKKIEISQKILDNFDLIWFINEDKISHFCYEITTKLCSSKGYPRDREYSTYDPDKRITPSPNSFTATKNEFDAFMKREIFTNTVMKKYNCPIITYDDFVNSRDECIEEIANWYGIKPNFREENKKEIIHNPNYINIFTNYKEIETWFR